MSQISGNHQLEDASRRRHKFFEGRVPRTEYRLTAKGRAALAEYLDQMEEWIRVTPAIS